MKLIKIFANKPFKTLHFNPDINIILGEPKEKKDRKKDTHNLGKSLLIDVIDFLFLKQITKSHVFKRYRKKFADYVFFMELELNNGKILLIRRSVEQPSKISFKLSPYKSVDNSEPLEWDYLNYPFDKAKEQLNKFLSFDVASSWSYRKSISYFLRKQSDFLDVFQLSKYNKGPHREWKPFIFNLLGFDSTLILNKYDSEEKIKEIEQLISQAKEKQDIFSSDSDKLKQMIDFKKGEVTEIEQKIDDFNFYFQDKKINRKLVNETDIKISTLNTIRYKLTDEMRHLEDSLKTIVPQIDLNELKQLFTEVEIYFPDNLVKEFKDLEQFNLQVSEERKKYMVERLHEIKSELAPIDKELRDLETQKSNAISLLRDKDSFNKFKHYQKALAKSEAEVVRLEDKLEALNKIGKMELQIRDFNELIKEKISEIKSVIAHRNDHYKMISSKFTQIITEVLNVPAFLSISQNDAGNIDFKAEISNPKDLSITAEGSGTTYKKLLCMAFDLAVLSTYSDSSFYKFVYHDGALESLDDRKKLNFLSAVRRICQENNLQYVMTVIDSDIPHDEFNHPVPFQEREIVLKLHDRDDSGRLFEMAF
jgi:uncharacterized protein YydD (DUF2326 family)